MSRNPLRALLVTTIASGVLAGFAANALAQSDVVVRMRDRCDPATFNAAIGPGTCVGREGKSNVTFQEFLRTLREEGRIIGWRFKPRTVEVDRGGLLRVQNVGGEVHTFTRVKRFAGGFVPELNEILGLKPAPECLEPPSRRNRFVAPGEGTRFHTGRGTVVPVGTTYWQCCIHPWMKENVTVG